MESVTRTVDGEAPSTTTYEYDQIGSRTALTTGGVRNEYGYDRRHRLGSLIKRTAAGALLLAMNYQVDASGLRMGVEESDASGLVRSVAYAYDAQSNTQVRTGPDGSTTYSYDDVNRLIGAITPQAALAYAYTADGLRIS